MHGHHTKPLVSSLHHKEIALTSYKYCLNLPIHSATSLIHHVGKSNNDENMKPDCLPTATKLARISASQLHPGLLSDAELLCSLLFPGNPDGDGIFQSEVLLKNFGGLRGLQMASRMATNERQGLDDQAASRIRLMYEMVHRQLKQSLQQEQTDSQTLKTTLRASEKELSEVLGAAQNTLNILEQNKRLQTIVDQLREEKTLLSDTNAELSDSTQIDWFVRGAAVSLIAFIIGILVTRIRWRKQDSWGSY